MQKKLFDYIGPDNVSRQFTVTVKLNSYLKLYFNTADIPEEIQKTATEPLRQGNNTFEDSEKLFNFIIRLIEDYESSFSTETKSKVILYQLYSNGQRDCTQEIALRYQVLIKVITHKGKETISDYFEERVLSGRSRIIGEKEGTKKDVVLDLFNTGSFFNHDDFLEMPWTAERELWFEQSLQLMKDLALQIQAGFGTRAQVLAAKIDKSGLKHQLVEFKEKKDGSA